MSTEPSQDAAPAILIVDDDPDISVSLRDFLEYEGYRPSVAATGTEAIDAARNRHYAAVLLDIGLPDIGGLEVLTELQAIDRMLPVIIITAYTKEEETVGALGKGAFA